MSFSEILGKVPDYREYLTVDELNASTKELAKDHPDTVKVLDIGKSRAGESITCLRIGEGKHRALIYAFPNPEEPVGGVLLDYLSRALAEDRSLLKELDYTWYLIKCIDPDGTRLNEGFLKGPFTLLNFVRNYYRTPGNLDGEGNFPYRYGDLDFNNPVPETRALMKIMDGVSFDFISSLHDMKWGGMNWQASEPCPPLYAPLHQLAKENNVPLRKRPGVFLASGIQPSQWFTPVRNYVKLKAAGKGPLEEINGSFTFEYAQLFNPQVFMMVPECQRWYDPRSWDDRPSDTPMGDLYKYYVHQVPSEAGRFMLSLYEKAEKLLIHPSPFLEMIRSLINGVRKNVVHVGDPQPVLTKKQLERSATIAEKIESEGRADLYRMFNLGAMIRMFDYELARKGREATLESCKAQAESKLKEWNEFFEKKYDCKAYPIRDLIRINLGTILYSVEYAKWRKTWNILEGMPYVPNTHGP